MVGSVKKFIDQNLRTDETFFDFTNRGILYFLFNRDCPIRQGEVALYQSEQRRREVIAAIECNPRVRAALVWAYLQQHVQPLFEEGSVVFWVRR